MQVAEQKKATRRPATKLRGQIAHEECSLNGHCMVLMPGKEGGALACLDNSYITAVPFPAEAINVGSSSGETLVWCNVILVSIF